MSWEIINLLKIWHDVSKNYKVIVVGATDWVSTHRQQIQQSVLWIHDTFPFLLVSSQHRNFPSDFILKDCINGQIRRKKEIKELFLGNLEWMLKQKKD